MIYRLRSYHGGLGDELQFSSLPEYLTTLGHEVYLLKNSKDVHPFRNDAISDFVWKSNPYIKGELEGEWNLGDLPTIKYENNCNNFIKNWERLFGLLPVNSLPNIYYTPKEKEVDGLIELSSISLKYNTNDVITMVKFIMSCHPTIKFKQVVNKYQSNPIVIPNIEKMEIEGLYNLFDHISSSRVFISLSSGSHSMGAAARKYTMKMRQYCILPSKDWRWTIDSKKFVYPGITYFNENGRFVYDKEL